MGNSKYLKIHSLVRMFAALLAIIVFISMFASKQIVHSESSGVFFTWTEAFFGDSGLKGSAFGFVGYLFVFIGGLAGLALVFIDEIIGKDLAKIISFAICGAMVLGALFMLLNGAFFRGFNKDGFGIKYFRLAAGPIVFGILSIIAGLANGAAPILEDKGL